MEHGDDGESVHGRAWEMESVDEYDEEELAERERRRQRSTSRLPLVHCHIWHILEELPVDMVDSIVEELVNLRARMAFGSNMLDLEAWNDESWTTLWRLDKMTPMDFLWEKSSNVAIRWEDLDSCRLDELYMARVRSQCERASCAACDRIGDCSLNPANREVNDYRQLVFGICLGDMLCTYFTIVTICLISNFVDLRREKLQGRALERHERCSRIIEDIDIVFMLRGEDEGLVGREERIEDEDGDDSGGEF